MTAGCHGPDLGVIGASRILFRRLCEHLQLEEKGVSQ